MGEKELCSKNWDNLWDMMLWCSMALYSDPSAASKGLRDLRLLDDESWEPPS